MLALALLERTGDGELKAAAKRVSRKIAAVVPSALLQTFRSSALHAWGTVAAEPAGIDLALTRRAIRDERKMELDYGDERGRLTQRIIWPLALIYYSETVNIVAWCELRQALRNFRADRVRESRPLDAFFRGHGERLRREWVADWARDRAAERERTD